MCCSIDDTAALLTNVEVRCILEQNRSGVGRARGERIDPRAEYIQNQVHLRPLNAEKSECLLSPAVQVVEYIDSSQCKQTTAESIARFIDAVKTFGLTSRFARVASGVAHGRATSGLGFAASLSGRAVKRELRVVSERSASAAAAQRDQTKTGQVRHTDGTFHSRNHIRPHISLCDVG